MIMDPRMEPYSAAGSRSSTGLKQRDSWRSDHCSEAGTKTCFCCGEKVEVRLFERRVGTPACSGPTVIASFGPTCAVGRLTPSLL